MKNNSRRITTKEKEMENKCDCHGEKWPTYVQMLEHQVAILRRKCTKRTREATLYKGAARRAGLVPEELLRRENAVRMKELELLTREAAILKEELLLDQRIEDHEGENEIIREEMEEWEQELENQNEQMEDRELRHAFVFPEE